MKFRHKGYILVQEEKVCHHYNIFNADGRFVFHFAYEGELFDQEEAKKHIEYYLKLVKMLNENEERLMNDECKEVFEDDYCSNAKRDTKELINND